ncbi:MAG: NAD(P)/FAD-dependent oxidoreductase [Clostridia bacterium]|nr:NAD(P)/FAD-dependent oxidoreductase [Clostridia bacterium]
MGRFVVIGGGAAGLFASYASAYSGNEVILVEKNEKLGKKIYITGKGRCNLSNYVDNETFIKNVVTNPKFLYASLNSLSPFNTVDFFNNCGLKTKVERGNRVFPISDKASDVTKCLEKQLIMLGVDIRLNTVVSHINVDDGKIFSLTTNNGVINCDSIIVCTGGLSYSTTGSTGDGYTFAKSLGHTIIKPKPSLVGLELNGDEYVQLQGLSLKNVAITCESCGKVVYNDFGEMLFTHFGVSGPIVLSASCILNKYDFNNSCIKIDLKPALTYEQLDQRLIREFSYSPSKKIFTVIRSLLPQSLINLVLKRAEISNDTICGNVSKEQRKKLVSTLKNLDFNIKGLRPINEAIVTSGGVNVKEINPKTMESKLVKGLYFAGEVIDVDAFTGGFNLQIAFSTGYLAGLNA